MSPQLSAQLSHLPERLGQHVGLTLLALAVGVGVSVPLAVLVLRYPKLRWPVLGGASVIQTVPSLALLALMVPLLDWVRTLGVDVPAFGFWPAALALVLYSTLPVLRNTVTGILGVEPSLIEAARGLGMTPGQTLLRVQLPLAAPVILAGIRTSAVWTVGVATLSTPVGQTSLGNYLFAGLQTRNWTAVWVGCAAAAGLALFIDATLALLERAAAHRRRAPALWASLLLLCLVAFGVSSRRPAAAGSTLTVGAKTFTEQYLLADVLARALSEAGLPTRKLESLGSTVIFDALVSGQLDAYVDYSGTLWANHLRRDDVPDATTVVETLERWLDEKYGVLLLGPLGFENSYALAMKRERAEALGIRTIEDLAPHAPSLRLGSDYEFFSRPEWTRLSETYGLSFAARTSFDSTFMYEAVRAGEVDVITAFSSDGRIAAYELTVLGDPRRAFPPYDAILLVGAKARAQPEVLSALRPLVGRLDVATMRRANQWVDVDRLPRSEAARRLWNALRAQPH